MKKKQAYFTCYKNAIPFLTLIKNRHETGKLDYQGFFLSHGKYTVTWWNI